MSVGQIVFDQKTWHWIHNKAVFKMFPKINFNWQSCQHMSHRQGGTFDAMLKTSFCIHFRSRRNKLARWLILKISSPDTVSPRHSAQQKVHAALSIITVDTECCHVESHYALCHSYHFTLLFLYLYFKQKMSLKLQVRLRAYHTKQCPIKFFFLISKCQTRLILPVQKLSSLFCQSMNGEKKF